MLDAEPFSPRPTLTNPAHLARTLEAIGGSVTSQADLWQRLTDRFVVDLDAVAAVLPRNEPEPLWLEARS